MKGSKLLMVIAATTVVTLGLSGISYAFHDGSVAYCDGCHTMHNAQGSTPMQGNSGAAGKGKSNGVQFTGNLFLLQGSDQSSTCLNCHGSTSAGIYYEYTIGASTATVPLNFTPGGDFGWLQIVPGNGSSAGQLYRRGHNIVAVDYSLTASPVFTTAPGSNTVNAYPASNFHCSSCHDPHGTYRHTGGDPGVSSDIKSSVFTSGGAGVQTIGSGSYGQTAAGQGATGTEAVGVYRLLAGAKYLPASVSTTASAFVNDAPIAEAPSSYNSSEGVFGTTSTSAGLGGATAELIVSYGSGMSEWCANCHGAILQGGGSMTNFIHPAGKGANLGAATLGAQTLAANYNSYIGSGNMTGTNVYTSLIPVENGSITTGASQFGGIAPTVTGNSNVMCLTCHRAHASAWQNMTRWDNTTELITNNTGYAQGPIITYNYTTAQFPAAYNGRPYTAFVANQRLLCNKCHAKD